MHILVVSQYFWPENFRVNDVTRGLVELGHQVTVLTGLPNYPGGQFDKGYGWSGPYSENIDGIRVIRVPLVPRGRADGKRLALNYLSFAFFASVLAPLRCANDYDVILVYQLSPVTIGLPAVVLRWLHRKRSVLWVQDLWPESLAATGAVRSPRVLRWVAGLVRFIYKRCDEILVQSREFIPAVTRLGVPAARQTYLPNSIEDSFRPLVRSPGSAEDAEMPQGFRIVFAGNLGAAQDLPGIVEAAERTRDRPDIQWIFFGDGRMGDWLRQEVQSRGLQDTVHLMGRRPAESMAAYFAAADVLLVTLRRDPIFALTIPSKVQAYLACARPVLAALDGEGARIIEEAAVGLTCPAESPAQMADAAVRLSRMPAAEREEMGRAGRRYFEQHFDRNLLLVRLEKILQKHALEART